MARRNDSQPLGRHGRESANLARVVDRQCAEQVEALFPNICPIYLENLQQRLQSGTISICAHITDLLENGGDYDRRPAPELSERIDERPGYSYRERVHKEYHDVETQTHLQAGLEYTQFERQIYGDGAPGPSNPRNLLKWVDRQMLMHAHPNSHASVGAPSTETEQELLEGAKVIGMARDCPCCCEPTLNHRFVYCGGTPSHGCCVRCFQNQAAAQISMMRFELKCFTTSGCQALFSQKVREQYLEPKTIKALDLIECSAVLRASNIEGLVECPFCPYAEICPSIDVDREFHCMNPECMQVSCRLCQLETHIPLSCNESATKNGCAARRIVEEAMTAALIRKCNKCRAPFIKKDGCNLMRCPRPDCGNLQCYVCSQSCKYSHFSKARKTDCPLWDDNVEDRHQIDVIQAMDVAKQSVIEQNPGINPATLEFQMSDDIGRNGRQHRNIDKKYMRKENPRRNLRRQHQDDQALRPAAAVKEDKGGSVEQSQGHVAALNQVQKQLPARDEGDVLHRSFRPSQKDGVNIEAKDETSAQPRSKVTENHADTAKSKEANKSKNAPRQDRQVDHNPQRRGRFRDLLALLLRPS